ncbi:hypothetical protein ACFSC6_03935 [Rufibacter sediminis]|uniref:Uncharacterized protein n=1 Tax=Rufibacter sediminis TaxID=2762756 RepID=A0ABR6VVL3_9BACT|nr:hypothetical protein [Rufibacter sediminis]MBC3541219.1 hypothetical protein [Rufibacter sediminis]
MIQLELQPTRLEMEQEQLSQAIEKLQKLQDRISRHLELLVEEITVLNTKVEAKPASDPFALKFRGLQEQAAILSHKLEVLRSV